MRLEFEQSCTLGISTTYVIQSVQCLSCGKDAHEYLRELPKNTVGECHCRVDMCSTDTASIYSKHDTETLENSQIVTDNDQRILRQLTQPHEID